MDLFKNTVLIDALLAWAVAQVSKTLLYAILNRQLDLRRLFGDGGMPSGHSAAVTAAALSAGFESGFSSQLFGIAAILAVIVMHDAMGVRREAGRHAEAINDLRELLSPKGTAEETLKEFIGHSPVQVFFGALTGALVVVFRNVLF